MRNPPQYRKEIMTEKNTMSNGGLYMHKASRSISSYLRGRVCSLHLSERKWLRILRDPTPLGNDHTSI